MSYNLRPESRRRSSYSRRPNRRLNIGRLLFVLLGVVLVLFLAFALLRGVGSLFSNNKLEPTENLLPVSSQSSNLIEPLEEYPDRFMYKSPYEIAYPEDGVKGIYLSAYGYANNTIRSRNLDLIEKSNLNAVVIDVKEDTGIITMDFGSDNELIKENTTNIVNVADMMKTFEEKQIYPIARIVVFKDTKFSQKHPEYSFKNSDGSTWVRSNGDMFSNPFMKEVWDYNVDIAIEAAKAGFKEIQFDYIRYAESFGRVQPDLTYSMGQYEGSTEPLEVLRVQAITDFIKYAKAKLKPYDVDLSVDIFGYTATVPEDNNIGQNFGKMANEVDIVSSMIYPSHWGEGYFGLDWPDKYPYEVVKNYIEDETAILSTLDHQPISRPWLQAFTASYIGAGRYISYGANEIKAQTRALYEAGINEFLLWNAQNNYPETTEY